MDKIVAIILAILVALVGFMVIYRIATGTPDAAPVSGVQCAVQYGGDCVDICTTGRPEGRVDCGEGMICCVGG